MYGDFEIVRREDGSLWELGRGAMGVTYKAIDRVLHRPVALKVIQLGSGAIKSGPQTDMLRERFLREARAAAALRHANVAGVFQFGTSDQIDRCFYAMEFVEGETLEARVRRDGPLEVFTALEVARQGNGGARSCGRPGPHPSRPEARQPHARWEWRFTQRAGD